MTTNYYPENPDQNTPWIDEPTNGFESKSLSSKTRLPFIRKVYGILTAQLSLTAALCIVGMNDKSFRNLQLENQWFIWVALSINLVSLQLLLCVRRLARKVPYNYFLLVLFTLGEAYLVSLMCDVCTPTDVAIALILTLAFVIGVTLHSMTTDVDFSSISSFMCGLSVLSLTTLIMTIFFYSRWICLLISFWSVQFVGLYLIYDTQLIIGRHSLTFEIDDYIFAAMILYIDIIRIFVEILRIITLEND